MYRVHSLVFQNAPVVGFGLGNSELRGQLIGLLDLRLAYGIDLDKPQAANAFQVHTAHKARAEYCGLQMLHHRLRLISERIIYRKKLLDWYHSDMVVRIRLGRGPKVVKKRRKNQRIALAASALLTPGCRHRHRACTVAHRCRPQVGKHFRDSLRPVFALAGLARRRGSSATVLARSESIWQVGRCRNFLTRPKSFF